jgi:hypothetical protein
VWGRVRGLAGAGRRAERAAAKPHTVGLRHGYGGVTVSHPRLHGSGYAFAGFCQHCDDVGRGHHRSCHGSDAGRAEGQPGHRSGATPRARVCMWPCACRSTMCAHIHTACHSGAAACLGWRRNPLGAADWSVGRCRNTLTRTRPSAYTGTGAGIAHQRACACACAYVGPQAKRDARKRLTSIQEWLREGGAPQGLQRDVMVRGERAALRCVAMLASSCMHFLLFLFLLLIRPCP